MLSIKFFKEKKKQKEDINDSFYYLCSNHVFSEQKTSSNLDKIDHLVDCILTQNNGKQKIINIVKKRLPTKEILTIILTLLVVIAAVQIVPPPLFGVSGSDVPISVTAKNVREDDSLFEDLTSKLGNETLNETTLLNYNNDANDNENKSSATIGFN